MARPRESRERSPALGRSFMNFYARGEFTWLSMFSRLFTEPLHHPALGDIESPSSGAPPPPPPLNLSSRSTSRTPADAIFLQTRLTSTLCRSVPSRPRPRSPESDETRAPATPATPPPRAPRKNSPTNFRRGDDIASKHPVACSRALPPGVPSRSRSFRDADVNVSVNAAGRCRCRPSPSPRDPGSHDLPSGGSANRETINPADARGSPHPPRELLILDNDAALSGGGGGLICHSPLQDDPSETRPRERGWSPVSGVD